MYRNSSTHIITKHPQMIIKVLKKTVGSDISFSYEVLFFFFLKENVFLYHMGD